MRSRLRGRCDPDFAVGAIRLTRVGAILVVAGAIRLDVGAIRNLVGAIIGSALVRSGLCGRCDPVPFGSKYLRSSRPPEYPNFATFSDQPENHLKFHPALVMLHGHVMAGARHYTELVAWQLADQIRVETLRLTRRLPFARDFKHQGQVEDAIDSVCRNIAEGFGCESHAEFARFLEIARRSLNELLDGLRSAELKGYVLTAELRPIRDLARREFPAIGSLMAYLRRTGRRRIRTYRTDQR